MNNLAGNRGGAAGGGRIYVSARHSASKSCAQRRRDRRDGKPRLHGPLSPHSLLATGEEGTILVSGPEINGRHDLRRTEHDAGNGGILERSGGDRSSGGF